MPGFADEVKGTVKKTVGKTVGSKKLTNEGRAQQVTGKAKHKVNDAAEGLKGAVKGVKKSNSRSKRG
ncbi:MAG: CsbD family protein [Candidatus Dormiibacterota bacterium]|jgi:uncharacterized protein YjbJ (UPF0337 family)